MSELNVTNIKHESSSSNNLVLASDGTTTVSGALTASGGITNAGTISAGTIGTGVTINAGTNVSGIGQLVGVSYKASAGSGNGNPVTLESNKNYHCILHWYDSGAGFTEYNTLSVNSSGSVTVSQPLNLSGSVSMTSDANNRIFMQTSGTREYFMAFIFEQGSNFDNS